MNRQRHSRFYDLHSLIGVIASFFLYVVCFSGAVAVPDLELRSWEDPSLRVTYAAKPAAVHDTIVTWIEEIADNAEVEHLDLHLPTRYYPVWEVHLDVHDSNDTHLEHKLRLDTVSGSEIPIANRESGLVDWLKYFHHAFMWPDKLGGYYFGVVVVSFSGIILLMVTVSGIVAHRKIIKQMFTLRPDRSVRIKWQDTHNVIGTWGVPFFLMIAITGAYFGLTKSYYGHMTSLLGGADTFVSSEVQSLDRVHSIADLGEVITFDEILRRPGPGDEPRPIELVVNGWGTSSMSYTATYYDMEKGLGTARVTFDAFSGEVDQSMPVDAADERVVEIAQTLHFGSFGGVAITIVYILLGLLMAVVIGLGNMMWIERRLHGNAGTKTASFYHRISNLNIGICLGFPVGTALIFHANCIIPVTLDARLTLTGWIYFSGVFAAIGYAFIRSNGYRATRELLYAIGAMFVLLPFVNWATTSDLFLTDLISPTMTYAWVDVAFLLTGLTTLKAASMIPKDRQVNARGA